MIDHTDAPAPECDNHRKAADDGEVQEKVIRLGDEFSPRALPERVIHDGHRNEEQAQEQRAQPRFDTDEEGESCAKVERHGDEVQQRRPRQAARGHLTLRCGPMQAFVDSTIQKWQRQKDARKHDHCADEVIIWIEQVGYHYRRLG